MSCEGNKSNMSSQSHQHDSALSWKIAQRVVICLFAGLAALIGFNLKYSESPESRKGDPDDKIAEFQSSLSDYVRTAKQTQCQRINGVGENKVSISSSLSELEQSRLSNESDRLSRAFSDLSGDNSRIADAKMKQTFAEFNFSVSGNPEDLKVHSDESLRELKRAWVIKDTKSLFINGIRSAAILATCTAIAVWLLMIALKLIWWFLMERLRDIATALKGR